MPIFIVIRIALVCVIVKIIPIRIIVGIVLICVMIQLVLAVSITRNTALAHNKFSFQISIIVYPFRSEFIISHLDGNTMNHGSKLL